MTTIAFDGKVLASDSQMTLGDYRLDMNTQKIFMAKPSDNWRLDGNQIVAYGVAGKLVGVQAVREALTSYNGLTSNHRFPKGITLKYIAITDKGVVYTGGQYEDDELPWMAVVQPPVAVGSGCEFAIGAMAAGASSADAVRIAAKFDINTGGPVQEI